MVDLDRDGRADVLSGSFAPGDALWFRGAESARFQEAQVILAGGHGLRVGRGSLPFAADWEGDGDLDLVVGTMLGRVFLVKNASGGPALSFVEPVPLEIGGVPVDLGVMNAAPVLGDWDQDGRADLLLGLGDGRVLFHRDRARSGAPDLGPAEELVLASVGGPGERGGRSKVALWDWNADGRTDLVLGEFAPVDGEAPVLDAKQRRELEGVLQESMKVADERGRAEREGFARWLATRKIPSAESDKHFEDFLLEWQATPAGRELIRRQDEIKARLAHYNAPTIDHGRLWVFLRRAKA